MLIRVLSLAVLLAGSVAFAQEAEILPQIVVEQAGDDDLSAVGSVYVSKIVLDGNTVLSDDEISDVTAVYEGRTVAIEELHDVRHALSTLYIERGYMNSGVVIPDQKLDKGVIRLQAVEGQLTQVTIDGNDRLRTQYIEKRIRLGLQSPLNVVDLQDALRTLQLNPHIGQINARLLPGVRPGESVLSVNIIENTPYVLSVGADNRRSPSVDENRTSLSFVHKNLTGFGDEIAIDIGITEGLDDYGGSYAIPVSANDMILKGYYWTTDSEIIEEPFNLIDITSETETWGLSLSRPFWRTPEGSLNGLISVENKRSASTLLNMPFSLSPGENDGIAEATVIGLSADWVRRDREKVLAVRGTVRVGIDALDATINENAPDSEFVSLLAQLQYAKRLAWRDSQIIVRTAAQIAIDPLLAFEKFAVGGHSSVRGYRENFFVRDSGFIASAELRFPPFLDRDGAPLYKLQLAAFVDYGIAWDKNSALPTSDADDIYSIGLGVLWEPIPSLSIEVYYGEALKDVDSAGDSLQENGLHFWVSYTPTRR